MSQAPDSKWIERARFAFAELADGKPELVMCRKNWVKSRFRFLISDKEQTEEDMNHYFDEMDQNNDGVLTWNEIINFVLRKQGKKLVTNAKHIDINCILPSQPSEAVKMDHFPEDALFLEKYNKFISFSSKNIIIWDPKTLQALKTFDIPDITAICYSFPHQKVIFVKKNFEFLFMDPENDVVEILPMSSTSNITTVTNEVPCSLCAMPNIKTVLVGLKNGHVAIISLDDSDGELNAHHVDTIMLHTMRVNKLIWIRIERAFASCSDDGTVAMFNVNEKTFESNILSQFKIPYEMKITSIIYDPAANDIFFAADKKYFGRWRPRTSNYKLIEVGNTAVKSMTLMRIARRKSMIIALTEDRFFWMFKQPEFIMVGCWKMDDYHIEQPATVTFATDSHVYAFGSYLSMWSIQLSLKSEPTFATPMIGSAACPESNAFIAIDEDAKLIKYKLNTGEEVTKRNITYGSKVSVFRSDDEGKRVLICFSNGCLQIFNTASLQSVSRLDLGQYEGGIVDAVLTKVYGIPRLLLVIDNQVILFNEGQNSKLMQVRSYRDNNQRIFKIEVLKHKYVLICAQYNENVIFDLNDRNTKHPTTVPNTITCISDIPVSEEFYLAGDDKGMLHLMSVNEEQPVDSISAFDTSLPTRITSMHAVGSTIAVANNLGYIKTFTFDKGLVETSRFRAHYGSIDKVGIFSDSFIYTVGEDRRVILFALSPPRYIGAIEPKKTFDIQAPSTWRSPENFCQQDLSNFVNPDRKVVLMQEEEKAEEEPKPEVHEPSPVIREPTDSRAMTAPRKVVVEDEIPALDIRRVMNVIDTIDNDYPLHERRAETSRASRTQNANKMARTPRIMRPAIKHPGLLPLFHSDGTVTVRIVERARNIAPSNVNDRIRPMHISQSARFGI